jgi:small-conductance mechanosensitive channel
MPGHIVAETFFQRYDHQLTALLSIAITFAAVLLVNRWLTRRGTRIATAMAGGQLSQEVSTRLSFLRRVVDVVIVVIGLGLALSQFTALDRLAGTVLASSAIAAAVIGFAARQPLANAIAGLIITVAQPLRIGDVVTFEGEMGVVEDIRLSSTWLRTGADARVIIPNERLAAGILRNDSIVAATVAIEVSLWLRADEDAIDAIERLRVALPDVTVRVADSTAEGVRLLLIGEPAIPAERPAQEARLREHGLRAIGHENAPAASNTP